MKGYASDWRFFAAWCAGVHRCALPATGETAALYVTHVLNDGRKISTAQRHVSAIKHMPRANGLESPCGAEVWEVLRGAQRIRHERPAQKAPLSMEQLRAICARLSKESLVDVRDRAILLLGFATALRRSTLTELDLADVSLDGRGATIFVRYEKQDQAGIGRTIAVPFGHDGLCAVSALRDWLERRGNWAGPLFVGTRAGQSRRRLSSYTIATVVKRAVKLIGLDESQYAGHSLRAGFVTEAIGHGLSDVLVASQTGHRSLATLRRYFRPADPFQSNACTLMGL
jgi:site-specific recombinase XerD